MRPSLIREAKHRRSAFTLIELLVAIIIIAILIAILMPAINAVRTRTRISQVKTEITALDAALTEFKSHFDNYPPSSITLQAPGGTWDAHSRKMIGKFWPQFDFADPKYPAGFFKSGESSKTLNGAECLVFFLGGMKDSYPGGALIGFSKSATRPFDTSSTTSRLGPFFNFNPSRLVDGNSNNVSEYLDPLPGQTQAYVYFSGYNGKGYRCQDWNLISGMADVYRASAGETDDNGNCMLDGSEDKDNDMRFDYGTAWKPNDFQIISPGFDYSYGTGGVFDPKSASSLLVGPRFAEQDNITNFHGGTLGN